MFIQIWGAIGIATGLDHIPALGNLVQQFLRKAYIREIYDGCLALHQSSQSTGHMRQKPEPLHLVHQLLDVFARRLHTVQVPQVHGAEARAERCTRVEVRGDMEILGATHLLCKMRSYVKCAVVLHAIFKVHKGDRAGARVMHDFSG